MTVNKEEKMISLLLEAYDIVQTRISVGDIVIADDVLYIDRSKEFNRTQYDPAILLTDDITSHKIVMFLKENGKFIGNREDSYYQWVKILLSNIKKKRLFLEDNLKLRSKVESKNRAEKLEKLERFSDTLSNILAYIKEENKLQPLVGMAVMLNTIPYTTGKLMITYDNHDIKYFIASDMGSVQPVTSIHQISLINDLRLRPYYNDAETIEEKLLGIVIDSSKLINMKVTALGVSVNGNRISVRSFSGTNIAEHKEFTENTSTKELYKFVSNALLYKNLSTAFIQNCAHNVYKSFNNNPLEYKLVKEWFEAFVKEYKKYLEEYDVVSTKQFIIDTLKMQLNLAGTLDRKSEIENLRKAIALTEKELNR